MSDNPAYLQSVDFPFIKSQISKSWSVLCSDEVIRIVNITTSEIDIVVVAMRHIIQCWWYWTIEIKNIRLDNCKSKCMWFLERFCSCMFPKMSGELVWPETSWRWDPFISISEDKRPAELPAAAGPVALEGFLPSVGAHVSLQVGALGVNLHHGK